MKSVRCKIRPRGCDSIQAGSLYTFGYDSLNRLDSVTLGYLAGVALDYGYDRYGNRNSLVFNDGTVHNHSFTYNKLNQLSNVTLPGSGQSFGFTYYEDAGRYKQIAYPSGIAVDYLYENNGPIQSIITTGTSGQIESLSYTYDNVLNVDTLTSARDGGLYDFGYDALYRLNTISYPSGVSLPASEAFDYDDVGNREQPGDDTVYQYDANHRLTQVQGVTLVYDNDGNLISRTDGKNYGHDRNNRLATYSDGSTTASYQYDPFGRRISKTVDGIKTWFVWDRAVLLAEYNTAGVRQKRYGYLPGEFTPIQMEDATGTYHVHQDHLGTPKFLTDASQSVVWSQVSEAFGESVVTSGSGIEFNFRFPGQYYDEESGLYYNYFRTYDPSIGRYIQKDPIGLVGGVNTYNYVKSNPVNLKDPKGLQAAVAVGVPVVTGAVYCAIDPATCQRIAEVCGEIINNLSGRPVYSESGDGVASDGVSSDENNNGVPDSLEPDGNEKTDKTDKKHSPDRQALNDLIDELTKGGRNPLSNSDADAILDWADELGVSGARDDRGSGHWEGGEHIHVPGSGINHIPTE